MFNTLSGVTSERCPSPRPCGRAHTSKVAAVASSWQRMEDFIGSGFEPHTSCTKSERDLLQFIENTFDRKRIYANPSSYPNPNSNS